MTSISEKTKAEYFSWQDWTDMMSLRALTKSAFPRTRFFARDGIARSFVDSTSNRFARQMGDVIIFTVVARSAVERVLAATLNKSPPNRSRAGH